MVLNLKGKYPEELGSLEVEDGEDGCDSPETESFNAKKIKKAIKKLSQSIIAEVAKPAFEKLKSSNDLWNDFLQTLWFSKQKVTFDQITEFRVLGRGAFGFVFGAHINQIGRLMAIKA